MATLAVAFLLVAAQQLPTGTGLTSPPSGDTAGYWQQGIHYTVSAILDERARRVHATGLLRYVNNSPDTLREMYFHQYLNAFRPGSRWSRADAREGRVRFQHLEDPDFGYERFTAPVLVSGASAPVTYPFAPDSTVARIALPRPLAPGDTTVVSFTWDARPSTVPRRQGRRGRHWDMAQWYPKVAVYDRGGWQHNPLQPAGEFYGEFGTYDVTVIVADDQVLAATGVPVSGDPGWSRALRAGVERRGADAYGVAPRVELKTEVPAGMRAVRFLARDVHHFAWSASPEFRYEGGAYVRPVPRQRFRTWDTVSVHVLYRPGDDTTWGGDRVVRRTIAAMQWLETIYGPYAYPQMTVMHRLDGGGTEFPMLQANGSPSQGLILHEGGHIWSYGILANNEWRSGWMDEGLTSYQTAWAQQLTPWERIRAGTVDRFAPATGYRARGILMRLPRYESLTLGQAIADINGAAEPMGTTAHEFRDFNTYNDMVYNRAEVMYGQLRDALGDTAFMRFLRDYYTHWALKHVDERSMRASAERASGTDLAWFFEQWIRHTGLTDYRLGATRVTRAADGWTTTADVIRHGDYAHPMMVGVRTQSGWTTTRMSQRPFDRETIRITTAEAPLEVRIDPFHLTWDWDRRNDVRGSRNPLRALAARVNLDWPFLDQADRERDVVLFAPMAWYSRPGGVAVGLRERGSYLAAIDRTEGGIVYYPNGNTEGLEFPDQLQVWWRFENPYLPWMRRPSMGLHGSLAHLDGILRFDLGRARDVTSARGTWRSDVTLAYADVIETRLMPERWSPPALVDVAARLRWEQTVGSALFTVEPIALAGFADDELYGKGEMVVGIARQWDRARMALRGYVGLASDDAPLQRALSLSADDGMTSFWNHWWRPAGSILKTAGVWTPLGGAGLRGFRYDANSGEPLASVASLNADLSARLFGLPRSQSLALWAHAFGDVAYAWDPLGDAGLGVSVRGRFYDRDAMIRVDAPFFVSHPAHAINGRNEDRWGSRVVVTLKDLW